MSDPENEILTLQDGAVALTDALGFRAAAKTEGGAAELVATINGARRTVAHEALLNNLAGEVHIHYAAISDTIVLAASTRGTLAIAHVVASVAASVVSQIASAASAKLPLAYRGCIAAGKLAIANDDLFVGAAIDEAAQWYERALAAIVWLTPAASATLAACGEEYGPLFVDYHLPIRDLGTVAVTAVNPFYAIARSQLINGPAVALNEGEMQALFDRLIAPLRASNALDVTLKLQNTLSFLSAARSQTSQRYTPWARRKHEELAER